MSEAGIYEERIVNFVTAETKWHLQGRRRSHMTSVLPQDFPELTLFRLPNDSHNNDWL